MVAVVSARKLEKRADRRDGSRAILSSIDLDIDNNEFLCVMGPSGSGKTTLLHLLAGLETPTAGDVYLNGKSLADAAPADVTQLRRDNIGQVFQFFNLMPNLTLEENVALPLAISGIPPKHQKDRIEKLIARFGLAERKNALPHELSGGEMQRTSIARALAGGQPLLLCDEPTGNLSQQAGLDVMQHLRRLADEDGKAIMLVTHNPRDAAFADRIVFLVDGKIASKQELKKPDISAERIHETLKSLNI